MKKLLIFAFLLVSLSASAAITGPYPVGPGVPPLEHAVARVARIQINLFPWSCPVEVEQFVSIEAYASGTGQPINQGMGGQYLGEMTFAEFQTYVLTPLSTGAIHDYQTGFEDWIIATKLPGWTRIP